MELRDIIPSAEQLELIRGVEENLLRRKRRGAIGGIVALIVAALQILIAALKDDYIKNIGEFFQNLLQLRFAELASPEGFAVVVVVVSAGAYLLFRWTSFLLKESEEPFRYTFWIEPFEIVGPAESASGEQVDSEGQRFVFKNIDRLSHLLHHDLMEMMNRRIRRLSLFDDSALDSSNQALKSHIRISGHYAIREDHDGNWVVQVMPRIRIGPATGPETLTYPVIYPLYERDNEASGKVKKNRTQKTAEVSQEDASLEVFLDAEKYTQTVEQVYSRIATEVYRQIESDVKGKIELFPTPFLRALALFHEAEDFARSNTVDAYDRAIELYKEALRYFRVAEIKWITKLLLRVWLWRWRVKFLHAQGKVEIGYAKCLIYRRQISALSGRYRNPLFEIPGNLNKVNDNLEQLHNLIISNKKLKLVLRSSKASLSNEQKAINRSNFLKAFFSFPRDSWFRAITLQPSQTLFAKQTLLCFEAYVVTALTYYYLGAIQTAKEYLADAKSVAPKLSERDPLYLLTAAEIEPDLDEEVLPFRQATEIAPEFEIAQFLLAHNAEMRFRRQDEIVIERAKGVIKEYGNVLKINPGNIAALAAQGYLYWLIEDPKAAKKKLRQGRETKAIVRQTYIGNLNYGLARIEAEEGNFDECYDLYTQAISVDPGVGAYSITVSRLATTHYYDYLDSAILDRFENYKNTVEKKNIKLRKSQEDKKSSPTINVVHSFVLNDYGNACFNYYYRFGDEKKLEKAIEAYQEATNQNPQNKIAYFNLQNAYGWRRKEGDRKRQLECLTEAEKLAPTWLPVLIAAAQSQARQIQDTIKKKEEERREEEKRIDTIQKRNQAQSQQTFGGVPQSTARVVTEDNKGQENPGGVPQLTTEVVKQDKKEGVHKDKLQKLMKEIDDLQGDLQKQVFPKIEKILNETSLSSLLEDLTLDNNTQKIKALLATKIESDKLDETDIEALRVWAEILSYHYKDEDLHWSKELCHFIQNYYPANFDTNWILYDVYRHLEKFEESEPSRNKISAFIENYRNKISAVIENWLALDSIQYASLTWATSEFFDFDQLDKFFEQAIYLKPENGVYYYMRGDIYYNQGNYPKAIELYDKAIEKNPNNDVYFNSRGNAYFNQEIYQQAINNYQRAIELDSQKPIYHCSLGRSYGNLNDAQKMLDHCKEAVKLRKNRLEDAYEVDYYYEFLAEAYVRTQKLEEFEKEFEVWKDLKEVPEKQARLYNRIGNLLFEINEDQKAISYYKKATQLDSPIPIYQCNLGRTYGKVGQWEDMIAHCSKAVDLRKNRPDDAHGLDYYYEFLAEACARAQRLEEFEAKFNFAEDLKEVPDKRARLYNRLGNLLFESYQDQKAIVYYTKATESDSQTPIYECNLGRSYGNLKNWENMIVHCTKAVALRKNRSDDYYGLNYYYEFLAEAYFRAQRLDGFTTKFESDNDLTDKERAPVYNRIGNLLFENEYQKAITYYTKATASDSQIPIYQCNLGRTYGNLGQWEDMIEHCGNALALRKNRPDDAYGLDYYYEFLAEAYVRAQRLDDFEGKFNLAEDLKDLPQKCARVYNRIGNLLFESYQDQKAIAYYTKATASDSQTPIYQCNLGRTYGNLRDWDKMIVYCANAVELRKGRPDDAYGLDYYYEFLAEAYTRAQRLQEFEKKFKLTEDLAGFHEKLARVYNRIGNLLFESARYQDAVPYYKQAITFDEGFPLYYSNLGRACTYQKSCPDAVTYSLKALELRKNASSDPYPIEDYYSYLAEAYQACGDQQKADEYFAKSNSKN